MARRDRTTGLPRPRVRQAARQQSRFSLGESQLQRGVWVVGVLLIALLVGAMGYRWFDGKYLQPNKTVLTVADEKFSLKYYTDRLFLSAQAQSGSSSPNISIIEQTLFTDLENEAIARIVAKERGISVSQEEVTEEIASQLGVPAGGAGTTFDQLYRQRLRTLRMSDGAYRRYTEAQVFVNKLKESFATEIGDTGELVTLRVIVSPAKADADKILERLKAGENLGTVAQTESSDLTSRQKDGLLEPEPARLLPDAVRAAIADKAAGTELFGPVEVSGSSWVFRIETRDPQGAYSETQKGQLADLATSDAIKAKRLLLKIERDMDSDDYNWANEHVAD